MIFILSYSDLFWPNVLFFDIALYKDTVYVILENVIKYWSVFPTARKISRDFSRAFSCFVDRQT